MKKMVIIVLPPQGHEGKHPLQGPCLVPALK